ncbi:hypothetical protein VitviT2T_017207 [Vitis vinifera]|uniref:CCHC-type domain-containing protein n=1 Tax=Vitis vinifera TaxID=29760 RepID=A0ABY9CTE4_VITVI|nr:hypothetical protein VitviT2T_017207 [Vitis vinifera]
MHEKLINIIDKPAITAPADTNDAEATKTYQKYLEECLSAKCIMLASMSPELQRQHEDMEPPAIIEHLKKMYGGQSRTARYQLSKALFRSSLAVNAQVGPHVLKMIDLIEQLEKLGCTLGKELSQDLILQSLPDSFSQFIVNFNMNKMSCDLHEMLNLLIDYENQVSSEKNKGIVMVVSKTSKKKGKGKYIPKRKPLGTKGGVTKPKYKKVKTDHSDAECFFCKEKGHWKRNCKKYLDSLKNKKQVSTTPYEIWKGRKPNLKHIKVWGCPAYVKKLQTDKLEARSDKCRFIGYPKETMGYYFYHPLDHKVFVARGGTFLEREFLAEGSHGKEIELDETQEETNETTAAQEHEMEFEQPFFDVLKSTQRLQSPTIVAPEPAIVQEQVNEPEPAVVQEQVNEPILEQIQQPLNPIHEPLRRSSRAHRAPDRLNLMVQDDLSNEVHHNDDDPKNYEEAMQSLDRNKWQEAMESEMESMKINKVWTLVEASKDIKPIGCKWVYKKKIGADGKVETYKARLVAKGYRQKEGIDYDETFSPVAMLKSIRILLAIAAYYDYEIWQMDVKTAFLNGELKEDVYMTQPEGYTSMSDHNKVCKLRRSIYGLKQASRSWNIHFNKTIEKFDFIKCEEEPCVYKRFSGSTIIFLVLYVDDILLIGNDIPAMQGTKVWLSKQFSMKDLGEAAYILGIKIYRDRSKRLLGQSQSMYIDTILKRYNMENSKRGYLPIGTGVTLSREDCPKTPEERERMNRVPYASAVGAIMYTMTCTRPDVAYALSVASRYQANPGEEHWKVVKTILKYLRRTKDQFLIYGESELKLKGYTDASFASDKDDSKSISGYVFTLNGGAVSWKSSKQATVANSTTEAEYIAASEAAKEAVWMKKFISELGVVPSIEEPIPLLCDNNGAIAQAKEPRSHQKSKHVLRRYHLIREIIERGDVKIEKIDGKENAADPFTKALGITQFDKHKWEVGMKYMTDWL